MDKIKCPACGTEVIAGTENCPVCGAPVGAISEDNISGVPIDNRAAIDTMLRGASRLVEESATLGIGIDDEAENAVGEKGNEKFQRTDVAELPPELSDNQKSAMTGGVINLTPDNPTLNQGAPFKNNSAAPAAQPLPPDAGIPSSIGIPVSNSGNPSGIPVSENAPGITLFEMDDNGNAITSDSKNKKEKNEKSKKAKSSPKVVSLAVIVALAVGLAGGFFGKKLLFPDFPAPSCQSFAEKAVSSVEKVISEEKKLYIAEAYVKDFATSRQCIFRAFSGEEDDAVSEWYRIKVDSDDSATIHVYLQLDTEEYYRLLNSDDGEERVKASVLMNIQNETDRCIEEAQNGEWETANTILLNNLLNPYTPSEGTAKGSESNSTADD